MPLFSKPQPLAYPYSMPVLYQLQSNTNQRLTDSLTQSEHSSSPTPSQFFTQTIPIDSVLNHSNPIDSVMAIPVHHLSSDPTLQPMEPQPALEYVYHEGNYYIVNCDPDITEHPEYFSYWYHNAFFRKVDQKVNYHPLESSLKFFQFLTT